MSDIERSRELVCVGCGEPYAEWTGFTCPACGHKFVQPRESFRPSVEQQLRGAVEALRRIAEGEVPLGQWGEMSQAMQRFAADAWQRAGGR